MAPKKEHALEARILGDQLADLKAGLFVSMPISTILSALILTVQALSGGGFAAAIWFLVVNAINAARLGLARYPLKETRASGRFNRDFAAASLVWHPCSSVRVCLVLSCRPYCWLHNAPSAAASDYSGGHFSWCGYIWQFICRGSDQLHHTAASDRGGLLVGERQL